MSDYHPNGTRTLSTFASLLREERKRLGWTQAEAAAYLDVGLSTYEFWEASTRQPLAVAQEGALARLYGVASTPKPLPNVGKPSGNGVDKL